MFWCEANFLWMKGLNELKINISVKSALQCNNYLQRKGRFIELIEKIPIFRNACEWKCRLLNIDPGKPTEWRCPHHIKQPKEFRAKTAGTLFLLQSNNCNWKSRSKTIGVFFLLQFNNFHQKFWSTTLDVFFLLQFDNFDQKFQSKL